MDRFILIDGNSLLFRAYFAMRDMVTRDGIHTQGVFAFINMLNKIIDDHSPDYMAVAFDVAEPTFRHKMYDGYKAGRQKTPIELLQQIPLAKEVLDAMNISVIECPGYEADDIIGTLSVKASDAGMEVLIITGDKDELQLIRDNVKVMINKRGVTDFQIYDDDVMMERYEMTPSQFIDLKGLMGDSSDNIPGIPGVGEKKGIALIKEYGSVEGVVKHADEIKGKLGENVRNNIESAVMSKELATITTDAPVDRDISEMAFSKPDYRRLIEIYKRLEFNSFIKKLSDMGTTNDPGTDGVPDESDIANGIDEISINDFYDRVPDGSHIVIDAVCDPTHTGVPELKSFALFSPKHSLYAEREVNALDAELAISELLGKEYIYTGYDLKSLLYTLFSYGYGGLRLIHDIEIAEYIIDPNSNKYDLGKMMLRYCNLIWNDDKDGDIALHSAKKLAAIYDISVEQGEAMHAASTYELFVKCEMPLIEVLASMEHEGVKVDSDILMTTGKELDIRIKELESSIHDAAGCDFNINSPKQLGEILFDRMGIEYPQQKKGKSGYSTAADVLEKISDEAPIASEILEYRKYTKLKSTYIDGLLSLIGSDGRIHPHFQQTVAATGRLSCTEPNLQNIPIRDEYGRNIRKAFLVSVDDNTFVGSDYSQIELRIMAALSGDEVLINAFKSGDDIHRLTASRVFNIPMDEVTSLDRSRAKAVNFGVIYGMSGFGLSEELGISRKDAQRYIDDYFEKHTAVKRYLDNQIEAGERDKQVKTICGRIRQIPEFDSRRFQDKQLANRLAMNTPIQGSAADIIKIAMIKVYNELKDRNMRSKLILQIHDELIVEAVDDEVEQVVEILTDKMENAIDLTVPLICDVHSGKTWYDLK